MTSPLHTPRASALDTVHAGGGPVAEIVRFRLKAGLSDAAFLAATQAMQPVLARAPGHVSRRLSKHEDGTWTDYLVWTDRARAEAAAREVFADPATRPFAEAIDDGTIEMRHEPIVLTME